MHIQLSKTYHTQPYQYHYIIYPIYIYDIHIYILYIYISPVHICEWICEDLFSLNMQRTRPRRRVLAQLLLNEGAQVGSPQVSTVQRRVSGLGVGLKTLRKGWENLGALGKIMEKHHPNVMVFPKKQLNTLWGYTVYHIFRAMMMTTTQ